MDIERILRDGYFDRLKIDGSLKSIYDSNGLDISNNTTFKYAIEKSDESYKTGLAHLRVQIIGESSTNINSEELGNMRDDRQNNGLIRLESSSNIDRYLVAYVNILLLKNDYAIPFDIKATSKSKQEIEKIAKTNDELELLLEALKLRNRIKNDFGYTDEYISIAIVDKVYVAPIFRRCGISTWLHLNLADIINMYGLVFPTGVVMAYGDFSGESEEFFNMSKREYNLMLLKHYENVGYSKVSKVNIPGILRASNILYKINIQTDK